MSNLKAKLHKENGFTLIEMLIVVAIIAILIAIAIPFVNKALERAREATDAANERAAIGAAMVEVLGENKLGGAEINDSSTTYTAYYKVDNSKGVLDKDNKGNGYGKGTTYGDVSANNVGKVIKVQYSTDSGEFTTVWE